MKEYNITTNLNSLARLFFAFFFSFSPRWTVDDFLSFFTVTVYK